MWSVDGFPSPENSAMLANVRRDNSTWFELIEDCNRLGMTVLPRLRPGKADNQKLLEAVLFARSLQSIQALVLLAQRAMAGDARTMLRSAAETVILQRKMNLDPTFADKLQERHDFHQRKAANALLSDPRSKAELSAEQVVSLEAVVNEINGRYPGKKPADVNLAAVAASVDALHIYDLIFRSTSGDAAHATLNSLVRHVVSDENDMITSLHFGPQTTDLEDTISGGISVLLHALDSAIESYELLDLREPLGLCLCRWKELVKPKPADAHLLDVAQTPLT